MIPRRKILCVWLAASMIFFGLSLGRGGAAAPSSGGNGVFEPVEENPETRETRLLNLDVPSKEKLFEDLMREGITLSAEMGKQNEGLMQRLGPGSFMVNVVGADNRIRNYEISFSFTKAF